MLFHINFFARTEWHTQKRFPGDDGVAGDLSFRLQCLIAFEVAVQLIVGETGAVTVFFLCIGVTGDNYRQFFPFFRISNDGIKFHPVIHCDIMGFDCIGGKTQ